MSGVTETTNRKAKMNELINEDDCNLAKRYDKNLRESDYCWAHRVFTDINKRLAALESDRGYRLREIEKQIEKLEAIK